VWGMLARFQGIRTFDLKGVADECLQLCEVANL